MKYLMILGMIVLGACTPEMTSQFDSLCSGIRSARTVLAGETLPARVNEAFDSAEVVCTTQPKDVASAAVTLAALYLVITKYQAQVK